MSGLQGTALRASGSPGLDEYAERHEGWKVVGRERYSAVGERRRGEAPLTTDQLYTGQQYNSLSVLYHYGDDKSASRVCHNVHVTVAGSAGSDALHLSRSWSQTVQPQTVVGKTSKVGRKQ